MFRKRKVNMNKGRQELIEAKIGAMIDSVLQHDIKIMNSEAYDDVFLIDENEGIVIEMSNSKIRVSQKNNIYVEMITLSFLEEQIRKVKKLQNSRINELKKELFKNRMDILTEIITHYEL